MSSVFLQAQAVPTPPDRLTYQGYVVDANGDVLGKTSPKNYDVIFRIWKDQTATDAASRIWSEQQTVTIDKGYFSVLLGEGNDVNGETPRLPLSQLFLAPDASERYIEITVKGIGAGGADTTIAPRLRFLASPYALLARYANAATTLVNGTNGTVLGVSGNSVAINKATANSALDVNGTVLATQFQGNGSGLNNLNANSLAGIVPLANLPPNLSFLDANQTFTGANTFSTSLSVGASAGATLPPNTRLVVRADDTGAAAPAVQFAVEGLGDGNRQLLLGYKTSGDYGTIQAINQGNSYRPLLLNPAGGNVGIGILPAKSTLDVGGDITASGNIAFGPNAKYKAPAGTENLRIIRGIINPNGTKYNGNGYQCSHPLTGVYQITFDEPFADQPVVTATATLDGAGTLRGRVAQWQNVQNGSVAIAIVNTLGGGEVVDQSFSFIAIGAR